MARQYMTDGQFEHYCRSQAEALVTQTELAVKRILPFALGPELEQLRSQARALFPVGRSTDMGLEFGPTIIDRVEKLERQMRPDRVELLAKLEDVAKRLYHGMSTEGWSRDPLVIELGEVLDRLEEVR